MVNLLYSITALQVKNVILQAFENLWLPTFTVLEATDSGHNLKVARTKISMVK